jgi:uncharacterized membrane protein (DUF485 family)
VATELDDREGDAYDDLPEAADDESLALQEVAEQTTYGEIFLADLISRQRRLALSVAAAYLLLIAALPLVHLGAPELLDVPLLGLPIGWLVLAVLVYPLLWALGYYFVATARAYEDEFTDLVR